MENKVHMLIKNNGPIKNRDLAEELCTCKRTVQRYKAKLKKKGFDIKSKSGKNGGSYIPD